MKITGKFIKYLFLFVLLLETSSNFAQNMNGWEKLGMEGYQSSQYLSDQKIIVVGLGGKILLSSDGGTSWKANNQDPTIGFKSVSFSDSLHGLIAGLSGKIFGSIDGGNHWNLLSTPIADKLDKILFVSRDTAFACGSDGIILRTENAGVSWDTLQTGISSFLHNLFFFSSRKGFAIGDSGIVLHTEDSGNTWAIEQTDSNLTLLGLDFLDSLHGVVSTKKGYVYRTSNGGKSWSRQWVDPVTQLDFSAINYSTSSRITITCLGGAFFVTTTGGIRWEEVSLPKEIQGIRLLFDCTFSKRKNCAITVGYQGLILLSSDSGKTWQQSSSCPVRASTMYCMQFFNAENGYAVGEHNLTLRTINGGDTWTSLHENFDYELHALHFINPDTGSVFGWYGWKENTTDGGKSFDQKLEFTYKTKFNDFFSTDRNTMYLVGDSILWKTIDGGSNWLPAFWNSQYKLPFLSKIFFATKIIGFSLGVAYWPANDTLWFPRGSIFKTNDAGNTWDTLRYGRETEMRCIFFWDSENGIVAGDSGCMMKTSDGGQSWRQITKITEVGNSNFRGINFFNNKIGYVLADYGKIFLTTNGGETWKLDLDLNITSTNTDLAWMTRIAFPDSNTVMVCGYQGFLRKKIALSKLGVSDTPPAKGNDHYLWVSILQNPAASILPCKLYGWLDATSTLKIYDILGRPAKDLTGQLSLHESNSFTTDIKADISSLSNGMYVIVLADKGYLHSERFIVVK